MGSYIYIYTKIYIYIVTDLLLNGPLQIVTNSDCFSPNSAVTLGVFGSGFERECSHLSAANLMTLTAQQFRDISRDLRSPFQLRRFEQKWWSRAGAFLEALSLWCCAHFQANLEMQWQAQHFANLEVPVQISWDEAHFVIGSQVLSKMHLS